MADINIERKRPSRWAWIIAGVFVLLLAWGAFRLLSRGGEDAAPAPSGPAATQR